MPQNRTGQVLGACMAALLLPGAAARANDLVLSANDGHTGLDSQGNVVGLKTPTPDTLSIIDVSQFPPRIVDTIQVPDSVVGPPMAVWVAPDESWAIVTSATKADPESKNLVSPDDRVSVIDLAAAPRIVQSLNAGSGAAAVRVSPDGKLALIANRAEGTVSIFTVENKRLTPAGKLDTGKASLPGGIAFLKDGKTALLTLYGDNQVDVLHIDGADVTIDRRPITTGVSPYTIDINLPGTLAAVSNMGRGDGDSDSVSLIELTSTPFHTVETVSVPSGPEPLKFSPDGAYLAVGAQLGTTKPASNPFHHDHGMLTMFAVEGQRLRKVAQAPIGRWAEGVIFSRNGTMVLAQDMGDRDISVLRWDGQTLTPTSRLQIRGAGPDSFGAGWP